MLLSSAHLSRIILIAGAMLALIVAPARALEITVGQQRILTMTRPIERLAIGSAAIADAQALDSSEIRLLGVKPGTTDLIVWHRDATGKEEHEAFPIAVIPDASLIRRLLRQDPTLAGLRLVLDGPRAVLEGTTDSIAAHDKALALARATLGASVLDASTVEGEQTVAVDIKFASVSTTALKELGLNLQLLQHGFQAAITPPSGVQQFSLTNPATGTTGLSLSQSLPLGNAFNLFLAAPHVDLASIISVLSSVNAAQFLAEPTLIVRSGHTASFLAGGEIPIPAPSTGNSTTATIVYHEFGVRLNIAATVLAPDRIALDVAPEVSDIDEANALVVNGFNVPAFEKRSASTSIELSNGQSFILAGLLYSTTQNVDQRIPGLGDLPIIGSFFKSTQNQRERQELVIIATPHIIAPLAANAVLPPLPGRSLEGYKPSVTDMLLDRNTLSEHVATFGLIP